MHSQLSKKLSSLLILFLIIPALIIAEQGAGVVVFDFVANVDVDDETLVFLSKGASDLVRSALANHLTVVERKQLNTIFENLKLELTDLFDQETVMKIGNMVGAKYSVMGSWTKLANFLVLTIRLVDNELATIVASEEARVNLNDIESLLDLPSHIAMRLLSRLDISTDTISRQTESKEALVNYSKAVEAYDKGDMEEAEKFAQNALKYDPKFEEAKQYIYYVDESEGQILGYMREGYTTYVNIIAGVWRIPIESKTEDEIRAKIVGVSALRFIVLGSIIGGGMYLLHTVIYPPANERQKNFILAVYFGLTAIAGLIMEIPAASQAIRSIKRIEQ